MTEIAYFPPKNSVERTAPSYVFTAPFRTCAHRKGHDSHTCFRAPSAVLCCFAGAERGGSAPHRCVLGGGVLMAFAIMGGNLLTLHPNLTAVVSQRPLECDIWKHVGELSVLQGSSALLGAPALAQAEAAGPLPTPSPRGQKRKDFWVPLRTQFPTRTLSRRSQTLRVSAAELTRPR